MLLTKYFPRQIASPIRKTFRSQKKFYEFFNAINGMKPKIYFSLYNCNQFGKFSDPKLDKIAFDIDSDDAINVLKKIEDYCSKNNYKRTYVYSTGGFWAYIFTKKYDALKYPKNALKISQQYICKQANLSYDLRNNKGIIDPHKNDIDFHIIGDIARVARMPGSYDIKRQRFCIPISIEDIELGEEHIKKKSRQQTFKFSIYGKKLFDISKFDEQPEIVEEHDIPEFEYSYKRNGMPPCVWSWITEREEATYRARYFATVWLKESGWTKSMVRDLLKKHYQDFPRTDGLENNWEHYKKVKVLDLVFGKETTFPSCSKLFQEGLCKGKCKYFGNANLYDDKK